MPFFSDDGLVSLNGRAVERHIVAGLAEALGAVTNPFQNYNLDKQAIVEDYLWAHGHHPFGPFSVTASLSDLMLDTIVRNAILSRLTSAMALLNGAVDAVKALFLDFIPEQHKGLRASMDSESITDLWTARPMGMDDPHTIDVVSSLFAQLNDLQHQFNSVARELKERRLEQANTLSGAILTNAGGFSSFVEQEVASVREHLQCCERYVDLSSMEPKDHSSVVVLLVVSVGLLGLLFTRQRIATLLSQVAIGPKASWLAYTKKMHRRD